MRVNRATSEGHAASFLSLFLFRRLWQTIFVFLDPLVLELKFDLSSQTLNVLMLWAPNSLFLLCSALVGFISQVASSVWQSIFFSFAIDFSRILIAMFRGNGYSVNFSVIEFAPSTFDLGHLCSGRCEIDMRWSPNSRLNKVDMFQCKLIFDVDLATWLDGCSTTLASAVALPSSGFDNGSDNTSESLFLHNSLTFN